MFVINLNEDVSMEELIKVVDDLNNNKEVNGIIVQLPLPRHLNEQVIIDRISDEKDVDGFNPINVGKLSLNQDCFVSCTPYGINTHRLLVRGTRIENITNKKTYITTEAFKISYLIVTPLVALPIIFILLLSIIFKPIEKNYLDEYLDIKQNNINNETI